MSKLILFLLIVFFTFSCTTDNKAQDGDSELGIHLNGEHELLKINDGYLRFDDGSVYFTWKGNDDKWYNNDMFFNQVIFKDTVVEKPFIKFRWKRDNEKYKYKSFNNGYVFFVLIYVDFKMIDELYINEKIPLVIKEEDVGDEEESSTNEYLYDY